MLRGRQRLRGGRGPPGDDRAVRRALRRRLHALLRGEPVRGRAVARPAPARRAGPGARDVHGGGGAGPPPPPPWHTPPHQRPPLEPRGPPPPPPPFFPG